MASTKPNPLLPHRRRTRRLVLTPVLTPGDARPTPVTKVGGAPWWPRDRPRPVCDLGHGMAFTAQVRLSDVPGLADETGLLSFHYCLSCTHEGRMSFGRTDAENRGYAVTLLENIEAPPDGLGLATPGCLPEMRVAFSDADEVLGIEDASALGLELPPDLFSEGEDDFDEDVGRGLVHVARSKLGGWPHWQQFPEWPTCREGRRMKFVMQLDYELGEESPWAGGGYAYLFVCGRECGQREADLVVQTS